MRINVHLEDVVLPVECGEGRQKLRWLAQVSCIRYGLLQDGGAHQFVPMRMERQPRFGELLPNRRSRELRLHGVINVELHDDAHITLWIRDTALDEKMHFSDGVLAGSAPTAEHGLHLSRLRADSSWSKGFEVGKGQSGQDALRHVVQIAAHTRAFDTRNRPRAHASLFQLSTPSATSLVISEALDDTKVPQNEVTWSGAFQEVYDSVDLFDLLVKYGPYETDEDGAQIFSLEHKLLLLNIGELLYKHFEELQRIFEFAIREDEVVQAATTTSTAAAAAAEAPPQRVRLWGFLSLLRKARVPCEKVPLSHMDRLFVKTEWNCDPAPDQDGNSLDLSQFLEAVVRVADVRYAHEEGELADLLERISTLIIEKLSPGTTFHVEGTPLDRMYRSKPFQEALTESRISLIEAFKQFAGVDAGMCYYCMKPEDWQEFVGKLGIVREGSFPLRQAFQTFFRAQGAFESDEDCEDFVVRLGVVEDNLAEAEFTAEETANRNLGFLEFERAVVRIAHMQCVNTKEEDERKKMTLGEGIEVPAVSAEILGLLHSLLGAISAAYDASGAL